MDELYDQDILCSIKSEDSKQSNKKQQKSNKNKQIIKEKSQGNNYYVKANYFEQEFQIRETIDFGDQDYQDKVHTQLKKQNNTNKNIKAQKQKSDSSDFGDTDQIITYVDKNKKYNLQIQTSPTTKTLTHKNANNPYQKILYQQKTTHYYEYPKTVNHFQQQKHKKIQKYYQHQYNVNTQTQQQQLDLIHMSIIGQRNKQKPGNLSNKKQQIIKQTNNSNNNKKQNKEQQTFQYNKSIYLNSNKKQPQIKKGIYFKLMDNTIYWVSQDKSIKVSFGTLQALVQQFFKRQIMLPLISDSQYKAQHIASYIEIYTKFLNDFFPSQFNQIFNILSLQGTKSTFTNPVTPKSSQNTLLKNLFNTYMPKFLQNLQYSKSSFLCDHMIKKVNLLKTIQKLKKQKQQDNIPFTQKIKQIYHEIAILQLLVSFENSQSYCKNNSKQGIDHRIWKQHGKKITKLRSKFIEKIENQQNDYSFII